MKTQNFVLILLILIATSKVFAQNGWVKVHPTATVNLTNANISNISFIDENTGLAFADDSKILKTTDGGVYWYICSEFPERKFKKVCRINNTDFIILCDSSKFLRSEDIGENWDVYSSGLPDDLLSLDFISDKIGFMISSHVIPLFAYPQVRLLKTTNGGLNWFQIKDTIGHVLGKNDIKFYDESTGYFTSKWLYITTNSGSNWSSFIGSNTNSYFEKVYILDSSIAYGVSYYATCSKVFCTGYSYVYKTTNAGSEWNQVFSGVGSANFMGGNFIAFMEFTSEKTGYFAKNTGTLYKTNNYGNSFPYSQELGNYISISNGDFVNDSVGYICGKNGIIYKTTVGGIIIGINQISSITPDNYYLSQNYPNPFNPSTKINYEIKLSGFVSLKVFDLVGKEVATLVNEKQNAGSYAVDFNSAEYNLPSGIYFYILTAGEFNSIKKMILIK